MINRDFVTRRLVRIETHVNELRSMILPEKIQTDMVVWRFAERTLQLAIAAAIDVAQHLVEVGQLGKPAIKRELFDLLGQSGRLQPEQVKALGDLVETRNSLVHPDRLSYEMEEYDSMGRGTLRLAVEGKTCDLHELLRFVDVVRRGISGS